MSGFQRTVGGYGSYDESGGKPNTGFVETLRRVLSQQTAEIFKDSFVTAEGKLWFSRLLVKIYTQMLFLECSLKVPIKYPYFSPLCH